MGNSIDIRGINEDLKNFYGVPEPPKDQSDIDYLIETILSQNTNDKNRDKAFKNLKNNFDDYREVEECDRDELIDVIRVAGLGPTKAERIQKSLRLIREDRGDYDLSFLEESSVSEAKKYLTKLPGIGPKTAAIILCFYFRKPVMPVDTHVFRVSKRLGLVDKNSSRSQAHETLEEEVPDDIKYELHRLMIDHGREICSARNPDCDSCILKNSCSFYKEVVEGDVDPEEFE